jgi:hypothetical protein
MDMNTFLRAQWDRAIAVGLIVLGALALLIGWLGVSGTALSYKQLPYIISGGLFGVSLIGIGLTLYLSADLRDEWRKLDALEDALLAATERLGTAEQPGTVEHASVNASVNGSAPAAARKRTPRTRAQSVETTAR